VLSANFSAAAVAGLVLDDGDLNTDIHASAEFRAHLVGVMLAQAIKDC
jgi:carbon-monoxide dehydrogenase medium subunit